MTRPSRVDPHTDCQNLLLHIAKGLEEDLAPGDRRALARHLRRCRRCGAFSKDLERTVMLFRRLGQEPLTPRARARARANIARLLSRTTRNGRKATDKAARLP